MTDHASRITILETQMKHVMESQDNMTEKLDKVLAAQEKYRGFWGAVLMIVSALWAAFTFLYKPHN